MRRTPISLRRQIVTMAAATALAGGGTLAAAGPALAVGGTLAAAGPALAGYGTGAVYQVELSANVSGPHGGGVWLWIELNQNSTGDYQGSDCGHGGQGAALTAVTCTGSYPAARS